MSQTVTKRNRRYQRYNWEKWFDGNRHIVRRDRDFAVKPENFAVAAYIAGYRMRDKGLVSRVTTQILESGNVAIQAILPEESSTENLEKVA